MRLDQLIPDHAGDPVRGPVIHQQDLANHICPVKVLPRGMLRDYHRIRIDQRPGWIAFDHRQGEDREEVRIRIDRMVLLDILVVFLYTDPTLIQQPDRLLDFGEIALHRLGRRRRGGGISFFITPETDIVVNPVNPVSLFMIPVIAQFIQDIKDDQKTSRNPQGETQDIATMVPLLLTISCQSIKKTPIPEMFGFSTPRCLEFCNFSAATPSDRLPLTKSRP
jgi:hypothetical protein